MPLAVLALGPFFSTLIGGLATLRLRHRLHPFMALAAGILVATALVDLLPEGGAQLGEHGAVPAGIAALVGFMIYSGLEFLVHRLSLEHDRGGADEELRIATAVAPISLAPAVPEPESPVPSASAGPSAAARLAGRLALLAPAGLIVHSTLDGLAIGTAYLASAQLGLLVLFAVAGHDFADGMNVVTLGLAGGAPRRTVLALLALDALAPVAGVLGAAGLNLGHAPLGLGLGMFAGAFLAIATGHLLPEARHHRRGSDRQLWALLGTGAAFAVLVRLASGL
jgi:ZIP family zinc transporter